jgi:hypothetical protein
VNTTKSNESPLGIIDFAALENRVPLSPRTLRDLIKQGEIPVIRFRGRRRLLFHWPSVENALLRLQDRRA